MSRQSVKDAVISIASAEPTARFSPAPCFPAIIRLLVVIPFPGKLLAEAFLEFSKPFWSSCCVSGSGGGWGGVRSWKMSVLSCAVSLTSNFFFRCSCAFIPSSLLADFPFKPLPHLRVAVLLMWKFSSVPAKMCASVCSAPVLWLWGHF